MSESPNMQQVEVQIMGQGYVLAAPADGVSALKHAVQRVDEAMCKIRDAGKIKARDRIAVLAALNLAFDAPAAETPAGAPSPALDQLIAKLDAALGDDGRLI
jgi:cell division protein ZapA